MVSKKLIISKINSYFNIYIQNMNFPKKLILAFLAYSMFSFTWVFAAWIDHFEVTFFPDTVKVWEALDLTIEAVDKNNVTILDYEGTILIFSESDPEAELPSELDENTYTFQTSDQWKIKFENAVKFKNSWLQNIHIYDLNDDAVFWVAEANITKNDVESNIDIEIVSPDNGLTIWENLISVTWTTQKNHQVKIIVNWSEIFDTTSNNDWIFEKIIDNLNDWDNTLSAQVLDSDLNIVWETEIKNIRVDLSTLNIKNVKVTPESVDPESSFEIEVITNPELTEVSIIINDILIILSETKSWVYVAKTYAPKDSWVYKLDVKIKDELGHEKTELGTASLRVNEIELEAAGEGTGASEGTGDGEGSEGIGDGEGTWDEDKIVCENNSNNITWLKLTELKTKSVLVWDKLDDVESYNVYKKISNWKLELVENVNEAKYEVEITWDKIKYDFFAIKAICVTASWELYEWALSDATKVKTGPEILILFFLSLMIGWFLFINNKKRA